MVSGMALKLGLVEGLLVHELSHIHRTSKNHPSHNNELLNRVVHDVIQKSRITEDYQLGIIRQAVNHIQDLYADDTAFKVFRDVKLLMPDQIFDFFLSWIKDKPADSKNTKIKWLNMSIMLNNCFAISNMMRHGVRDVDNRAEKAIERFLSRADDPMKKDFAHFKDLMMNLKEDTTEKEFEKDLTEYLTRILEAVK